MPVSVLKTVKVVDKGIDAGFRIINEEDFDKETMKLYRSRSRSVKVEDPVPAEVDEVIEAIKSLDVDDSSNWTASGLPQITALEHALPGRKISAAVRDEAMDKINSEEDEA